MKIRYFPDTDTLQILFRDAPVAETRNFNKNTLVESDNKGDPCSITIADAVRVVGEEVRVFATEMGGQAVPHIEPVVFHGNGLNASLPVDFIDKIRHWAYDDANRRQD